MPDPPKPFGPDSKPCPHCDFGGPIEYRTYIGHSGTRYRGEEMFCAACGEERTDVTWPEED